MRANMSDSQDADTATATQPITVTRLRWLDLLSKYRQPLGLAVTLLLFAIALIACRHLLSELDFYACLLYTSPSPRDLSTSRMPSSA